MYSRAGRTFDDVIGIFRYQYSRKIKHQMNVMSMPFESNDLCDIMRPRFVYTCIFRFLIRVNTCKGDESVSPSYLANVSVILKAFMVA